MEIISSQPFLYVFMGSMTVSPSPHRHLERSCLSVVEQRVLSARETLIPEISCCYAACIIEPENSSQPFWYVFMDSMTVSHSPHRHLERSCLSVIEQRVLSIRETLSREISCCYAACIMGPEISSQPFLYL